MEQLIAHLIGDYVLQNHWMALTKTKSLLAVVIHGTFYSLPFVLLVPSWRALFVIWATHILIDRFRLAKYWVDFWGVGTEGQVIDWIMTLRDFKKYQEGWTDASGKPVDNPDAPWVWVGKDKAVPAIPDAPPFLAIWLLILVDNAMHLTINYISIRWL